MKAYLDINGLKGLALVVLAAGLFSCRNSGRKEAVVPCEPRTVAGAAQQVSHEKLAGLLTKIKASRGALSGMSYRVNAVLKQGMILDAECLTLLAGHRKSSEKGVVRYSLYNVRGPHGATYAFLQVRETSGEIVEVRAVSKKFVPARR